MRTWISSIVEAVRSPGVVPERLRGFVAFVGVLVISACVAVFIKQAWEAEVNEITVIYTALLLVVGLALIRSAVKKEPPP